MITNFQMSTYLLAFIVSNYEGSLANNEKFGVYARPEAQIHTNYSVEFGVQMLDELGKYFGIDYYAIENVEKLDMAGIPDFSAGGKLVKFIKPIIIFHLSDGKLGSFDLSRDVSPLRS